MYANKTKDLREKRFTLWNKQDKKCFYCEKILEFNKSTVDHIKPRCRGGSNDIENLVMSCKSCNSAKSFTDKPTYKKFINWPAHF